MNRYQHFLSRRGFSMLAALGVVVATVPTATTFGQTLTLTERTRFNLNAAMLAATGTAAGSPANPNYIGNMNAGCLEPLKILTRPGSMLAPLPPAAVVAGNVETSQHVVDALYAALGVMANSAGTMNNFTFGDEALQYYETICGGTGATAGAPGTSAVQSHMTNSRLTDPEILERRFPVRVEHFGVRAGSGGAGIQPGGDGSVRRIRFLAPMEAALLSSRRETAPQGLAGGGPGLPGTQRLIAADGAITELPGCFSVTVRPGETIEIATPGGGGFGPPEKS